MNSKELMTPEITLASKSANVFRQSIISKYMKGEYGVMGRFFYTKMKRPGNKPDPLTLALHGPSTFDEIELNII